MADAGRPGAGGDLVGGPVDPRYEALGGPIDLRGLDGVLLAANRAALAVTVVGLMAAAASLVGRFRDARGVERLQLRWVALAAVLVGLGAVGVLFSLAVGGSAAATLFALAIGCCTGDPTGGHRGGDPALPPLRPGPHRQPHPGLRAAHPAAGRGYALVVLGLGQLLGRESTLVVAAATWPWRRCSSRPAAGSKRWWIGGSTGDAMTRQDHRGVRGPAARPS